VHSWIERLRESLSAGQTTHEPISERVEWGADASATERLDRRGEEDDEQFTIETLGMLVRDGWKQNWTKNSRMHSRR
jgi:hypothetical protein